MLPLSIAKFWAHQRLHVASLGLNRPSEEIVRVDQLLSDLLCQGYGRAHVLAAHQQGRGWQKEEGYREDGLGKSSTSSTAQLAGCRSFLIHTYLSNYHCHSHLLAEPLNQETNALAIDCCSYSCHSWSSSISQPSVFIMLAHFLKLTLYDFHVIWALDGALCGIYRLWSSACMATFVSSGAVWCEFMPALWHQTPVN